ncbi:hypothetical protein Psch_03507 [Pelotomaculum schinkii]|uniref:Uncharacterized protein n=1 Tax=Pelotomaculum schinkii TaxID=78350 RepID=A0A4Y7R740_9FIRM|nr:hypothetical protein [Pelotomaculum schinkii]TEB04745.1 hypothetical protein Psch_03507 [Pelotomaculum schinkii]
MATEKRSIRFPLPVAKDINRKAADEHLDFSNVVIDLCRRQLGEDNSWENTRTAALYSRAAFLAVSELLAMAKKEDVETVRRALLARAGRRENWGAPGPGPGTRAEPGAGQGQRD